MRIGRIDVATTLVCAASAMALTAAVGAGMLDSVVATADGVRAGQLWRLFTGPLVHATWGHLVRDLALLIALGLAYGPVLVADPATRPMFESVARHALCGDAPLLRELGLDAADVRDLRLRLVPRAGSETGDLPLVLAVPCP